MNQMECWIPDLLQCKNLSEWRRYDGKLYAIFKRDWIDGPPEFMGLPVRVRHNPKWGGREEGYWHLTCCNYSKEGSGPKSRDPDMDRCERIEWPRAFVENYQHCDVCEDNESEVCSGVIIWKARSAKGRWRYKLFHQTERYIVVIEPRKTYCLLITAYFISSDYSLKSVLREYEQYSKAEE